LQHSIDMERIRAEYNVRYWSQGFYGINDQGEVYVSPRSDSDHQVALSDIAAQLEARNLSMPALVRFPQILHQRVHNICDAFNQAIKEVEYDNRYLLIAIY